MKESGSLSSPQQTKAKSLLKVTGELYGLRVADLNESNSTSQGRKSVLESNSSSCSVSDLHSIFNLSQATARIEREVKANQFVGTTKGQCCLKQLKKSVSDKIDKFELINCQSQRPTVITPTPPGSPKVVRAGLNPGFYCRGGLKKLTTFFWKNWQIQSNMSSLKSRMPSFRNGRSSLKSGMPSSSLEKKCCH